MLKLMGERARYLKRLKVRWEDMIHGQLHNTHVFIDHTQTHIEQDWTSNHTHAHCEPCCFIWLADWAVVKGMRVVTEYYGDSYGGDSCTAINGFILDHRCQNSKFHSNLICPKYTNSNPHLGIMVMGVHGSTGFHYRNRRDNRDI